MRPSYQLERLNDTDLLNIELEINPSHELVRALVRRIREQEKQIDVMEDEFTSLLTLVDPPKKEQARAG
tara:strand:+ start:5054 stop:5260 length:207 start_codon:yes stop_codon:yes gene_type:complete